MHNGLINKEYWPVSRKINNSLNVQVEMNDIMSSPVTPLDVFVESSFHSSYSNFTLTTNNGGVGVDQQQQDKSNLLSFLNEESIWSVVHVIFSYHTYLYSRHWRSVVMGYYIFISLQLYLFSLLGWSYSKYFSELSEQSSEIQFERACFSVTCNTLFIGGSIQTLLGIFMGVVHAELFSPCKYDRQYFHPVSFFKDYALKKDKTYNNLIKSIERKRRFSSSSSPSSSSSSTKSHQNQGKSAKDLLLNGEFVEKLKLDYGLWPWRLWLGWTPADLACCGNQKQKEDMNTNNHTGDANDDDDDDDEFEFKRMTFQRWEFRRRYWKRWFQLTLLGMPATIFLTLDGEGPLKAGLLLYGLITTSLLVIFKKSNEYDYVDGVLMDCDHTILEQRCEKAGVVIVGGDDGVDHNDDDDIKKKMLINANLNVMLNNYDKLYTTWIFSTVFIIGFHNIPFLTSFYRVLLAVLIVVIGSLMLKLSTFLLEKYCVTK